MSPLSHGAAAPSAAPDWAAADSRAVDFIRVLAMDAVQQAGSGRPGTAMSLAPAACWPAGLRPGRQDLPVLGRGETSQNGLASADAAARGGYMLAKGTDSEPAVILIATGSEVRITLAARDILQDEGISTRVVPCRAWNGSPRRMLPIRRKCCRHGFPRPVMRSPETPASVSAWSIPGASAAQAKLYEEYGFTPEQVAAAARSGLGRLDANVRSEDS